MDHRTALIVIGTFRSEWFGLAPVAQAQFIERVGKIAEGTGLKPLLGYRLSATPGAFLEVWEGGDRAGVERMVKELQAMGYTHFVDARWLIGERELGEIFPVDGKPASDTAESTGTEQDEVAPRKTTAPRTTVSRTTARKPLRPSVSRRRSSGS